MIAEILKRFEAGETLGREDLLELLEIEIGSQAYYQLLETANGYSRKAFAGRGLIFGQIGLDDQPCSVNCRFCSLAADVRKGQECSVKCLQETVETAMGFVREGVQDVFLMTTADFSQDMFLQYGAAVKKVLPQGVRLVANVGDFDLAYAEKLKETGFTGVYHICRLGEGKDTGVSVETRVKTMDAVKAAGLELYYCVEPIGPEHTNAQLVDEMLRPREYPVGVMAVMRRVAVPGTPLESMGEISSMRLAQICAAATLAMRPQRAMCVHEPDQFCLAAGANQLYAEYGRNPRDTAEETSKNRGFSVADAKNMFRKMEWSI